MNDTNTANAYLKTKVMTASPEELRLLLLDGGLKFAKQARAGLVQNHPEMAYEGFTQCRDIVLELLNTIKDDPAPQIARAMKELYTFLYGELIKASIDKDLNKLDEVISLLEYDRETWVLTMEQLVKEREMGIAGTIANTSPNTSSVAAPTEPKAHQPISFQA